MNVLFYEYILRMAISCYSLYIECTDNILYRLITVSVKIVIYSFYHFHCNRRINEVCRTNLDGRGTCKHEFHSIFPVHDTDIPPVTVESIGRLRSASIAIPSRVLMRETLSAPPFSAARAISVMSVTFGESFTISVFL